MLPEDADTAAVRRLVARLRFRHLQLLVELRRTGSLRAAAGVLNLTQPALSKSLREVEAAFGFELFTRTARGLEETERGVIAIRGAAALLSELGHVATEAAADRAMTVLRIGAPPFVAQGYLPAVFADSAVAEASLRIELTEERVPFLVSLLVEGRLDVLITSYPADLPDDHGAPLRYERLFDADFSVIARIGHPLGRARRVRWGDLREYQWVMPGRSSMVYRMVDDMFRRQGLTCPVPTIESTSPITNCRLVAAGLGLSAVPAVILGERREDRVTVLNVSPALPPSPVALVSRAGLDNPRVAIVRRMLTSSV